MDSNWYVLTGAPGSGKTTVLEELKIRGYNTVKEIARYHIENQLAQGLTLEKIRDEEKAFQEAVFKQKKIVHEALETKAVTFFDRGYHDTIAYLDYFGHEIAKFISETCQNTLYKKVFVLDMLPYKKDRARIESPEVAEGLHNALIKAYELSGHNIIRVPTMSVNKRADFILNHTELMNGA